MTGPRKTVVVATREDKLSTQTKLPSENILSSRLFWFGHALYFKWNDFDFGVAASLAIILYRPSFIKSVVLREQRTAVTCKGDKSMNRVVKSVA